MNKPTKQDFINVFTALAEALDGWNSVDVDEGSRNNGLIIRLYEDGGGQILHGNASVEHLQCEFDNIEELATWAMEYIGSSTSQAPLTDEDWHKAKQRFDDIRQQYLDLQGMSGVNTQFALHNVFLPLALRFNRGERTQELYKEMLSVQ